MEKRKKYRNCLFDTETIRAALEKFNKGLDYANAVSSYRVTRDDVSCTYDTIDEFCTEYRNGFSEARLCSRIGHNEIVVDVDADTTTVWLNTPENGRLAEVFELFEAQQALARRPTSSGATTEPRHPSFSMRKGLSSLLVTRELLEHIETYLLNDMITLMGVKPEKLRERFYLRVIDKFGTASFGTASDMPDNRFADGTSEIAIGYSNYGAEEIRIELTFVYGKVPQVAISSSVIKAREKVIALFDAIKRISDSVANSHGLFYPRKFDILGFLFTAVLFGVSSSLAVAHSKMGSSWLVATYLSFAAYWGFAKIFLPYTAFDTRKYEMLIKARKWVLGGLVVPIILGAWLIPLIRNLGIL